MNRKSLTNDPAFPIVLANSTEAYVENDGITVLQYFAAAALTGLLANPEVICIAEINGESSNNQSMAENIVTAAFLLAQKMAAQ